MLLTDPVSLLGDSSTLAARESVTDRLRAGTPGKCGSGGVDFSVPVSFGEKKASVSGTENAPKGSVAAAISNATVQLVREYTGRGPTKARTHMGEDLITVVLEDTLTMGERSLVRDGRVDLVLATRKAFQQTMASQLIAAVERYSGRKVRVFLSDNRVDPDVAVESFLLVPRDRESIDGSRDGPAED